MEAQNVNGSTKLKRSALALADRGKEVFPCSADKIPLVKWREKATTDPKRVSMFWSKHPGANIGIPTGPASGLLVIDLDTYKPGAMTVEEFEQQYGEIQHTLTARTGNGGLQFYFVYPSGAEGEINNSAGLLGTHVDVRGQGGYVLAPPSVTTGRYEWIKKAPVAPVPPKLLEALREKPERPGPNVEGHDVRHPTDLDDTSPIPEGCRNQTLASIGGRLRSYGFERDEIEASLHRVNAERCSPPLAADEVGRIAASVSRYEPGKGSPPPDAATSALVDEIEEALWRSPWPKIGGRSERSLAVVVLKLTRRHGRRFRNTKAIEVDVSHRVLALAAATSPKSVRRAIKRSAWLRQGKAGGGRKSGSIIVSTPGGEGAQKYPTLTTGGSIERESKASGDTLRAPFTAPRLRWSAPGILRLGKSAEAVIDYLERTGGEATVEDLADFMHVSRPRDFRRRVIARLEERNIITVAGDTVALVEDWLEALNVERQNSGEIRSEYGEDGAYERDMKKFNQQREAYRNRRKNPADKNPPMPKTEERSEPEMPEVSLLAAVLHDYLYHHTPADADQRPEWLANMLWAEGRYPGKPTHLDVSAALEELGGDRFRLDCLARARANAGRRVA